jgi:hypothetical protein
MTLARPRPEKRLLPTSFHGLNQDSCGEPFKSGFAASEPMFGGYEKVRPDDGGTVNSLVIKIVLV